MSKVIRIVGGEYRGRKHATVAIYVLSCGHEIGFCPLPPWNCGDEVDCPNCAEIAGRVKAARVEALEDAHFAIVQEKYYEINVGRIHAQGVCEGDIEAAINVLIEAEKC